MGVPAFFRWLSQKYPSIVVYAKESKGKVIDEKGNRAPVDFTEENPNGKEYDNFYLDMNGIIHPCTHPENKPAPKTESEMFVEIFEYIDRLMNIVRPRKVLYMAIDGVAPRAKMNQQRSRRFRAAKETHDKAVEIDKYREELIEKGAKLPPPKAESEKFDSNCITPGTPFMTRLSCALRYYIYERLNSDPGWRDLQVFLSDSNVPGEGEHKIMDFIRRQRASPDHNPNTKHCLCGADADLIMLGLATHEPHFTIIREEFKPNQPRPCELCGQIGHEMKDCVGLPQSEDGQGEKVYGSEPDFIFIHLYILRQYLEVDLKQLGLPFEWNLERALDDWVFMCFFVGNDFLPHLPSLEIREGAIDRLIQLYKQTIHKTGSWLTDGGDVSLDAVQLIMVELGKAEDTIFRDRRHDEMNFRERKKKRNSFGVSNKMHPGNYRSAADQAMTPQDFRKQNNNVSVVEKNLQNLEAATTLKAMLKPIDTKDCASGSKRSNEASSPEAVDTKKTKVSGLLGGKGRSSVSKCVNDEGKPLDDDEIADKCDEVRLWEDGFRERYYLSKFGVKIDEHPTFPKLVAKEYVRGLCWVLAYYYQGCLSWDWYFPYHYAPFASDFSEIAAMEIDFRAVITQPFKPLQQLMSVFPAASRSHVPPVWQDLMTDPKSPIIDFYPTDFKIDLNGKKYAWMGVALLPFVDEKRLLKALNERLPLLSEEELARNIRGPERYFVHVDHPVAQVVQTLYDSGKNTTTYHELDPLVPHDAVAIPCDLTSGLSGLLWSEKEGIAYLPDEAVPSAVPSHLPSISHNKQKAIMCAYSNPEFPHDFKFPATLLDKLEMPALEDLKPPTRGGRGGNRGGGGYQRRGSNNPEANRMIQHSMSFGGYESNYRDRYASQHYQEQSSYNEHSQRGGRGRGGNGGWQSRGGYHDNWRSPRGRGDRDGYNNDYNRNGNGRGRGSRPYRGHQDSDRQGGYYERRGGERRSDDSGRNSSSQRPSSWKPHYFNNQRGRGGGGESRPRFE